MYTYVVFSVQAVYFDPDILKHQPELELYDVDGLDVWPINDPLLDDLVSPVKLAFVGWDQGQPSPLPSDTAGPGSRLHPL
jgi:hypothetical protein